MKKYLPYSIILILTFYLLPGLLPKIYKDGEILILTLLIFEPLICLIISIIYAYKNELEIFYYLLVLILFLPSIYIFYNDSALIYLLIYLIIALIGNLIGLLLRTKKKGQN